MQPTDLRSHNLADVLTAIARASEPLSRAGIAQATGLTKPTVSKLVEELLEGGLIIEGSVQRSGASGRPTTPLLPASGTVCGLGIEVSADHTAILARDLAGNTLVALKEYDSELNDPKHAAELVGQLIAKACNALPETCLVSGIAIAIPGRMSADRTRVISSPGLSWQNVDFASLVHQAAIGTYGAPLTLPAPLLGNDSRLVARSELISRDGQSFLLVHGETGIGGTVVLNGDILHGALGWAGEIGHTVVKPDGPNCRCGRTGCLEAFASAWALREKANLAPEVHIDAIAQHLDAKALHEVGHWLGIAIANALTLLDLQTVVLSGYFGELFDTLEESIRDSLEAHCLGADAEPITLARSQFDSESTLVGATQYALLSVLTNPAAWVDQH